MGTTYGTNQWAKASLQYLDYMKKVENDGHGLWCKQALSECPQFIICYNNLDMFILFEWSQV